MNCRHCGIFLKNIFLDLGHSPPSNAYLTKNNLHQSEICYPLKVLVCDQCWLVQTKDYINAEELFTSKYAYFSSISPTWLVHAKNYTYKIFKIIFYISFIKIYRIFKKYRYRSRCHCGK